MVCSTWASNLVWVLLGVNWLMEGRWREKWLMAKASRLLQAYLLFYLILMIGMLWTQNQAAGWSLLQVKLPMLVVPLVMLTTRPIQGRQLKAILSFYSLIVIIVSMIAAVRMLVFNDMPYREAVPYISHIRFALNCCMVIFIMVLTMKTTIMRLPFNIIRCIIVLWMLLFLVLIHSYTAFGVLILVTTVLLVRAIVKTPRRWPLLALWLLLLGGGTTLVLNEVRGYYALVPMAKQPLKEYTAGGHPYEHACDGLIENGNYINNYVCRSELRPAWERRSTMPYDSLTVSGYSIESTLVRYLNNIGLTKDSVGVATMSAADVAAVERGVANPVYENGNPLRKMVYVMLLEREFYVHTKAVAGFTMLQRFELWRATWRVIRNHPAFGVGTGDAIDDMHAELVAMDSELAGTTKKSHNEYLSLLAMVGFVGVSLIVGMFILSFLVRSVKYQKKNTALMLAWVLTILISFLTEDTLDTLAGILFCTYFIAFRNSNVRIPYSAQRP